MREMWPIHFLEEKIQVERPKSATCGHNQKRKMTPKTTKSESTPTTPSEKQVGSTALFVPVWNGRGKYIQRVICCKSLADSMQSGTDGESYGSCASAYNHEDPTSIHLGTNLPTMRFCPWCGFEVAKLSWTNSQASPSGFADRT